MIALPGPLAAARRVVRLSPALFRRWVRNTLLSCDEPVADPIDEGPLPEKSGSAD